MSIPADNRRSPRNACLFEASLSGGDHRAFEPPLVVDVVNISTVGVGLRCDSPIDPGTLLKLKLQPSEFDSLPDWQVRVIRSSDQEDGTWIVGAELLQPLTEEEFTALLQRPT